MIRITDSVNNQQAYKCSNDVDVKTSRLGRWRITKADAPFFSQQMDRASAIGIIRQHVGELRKRGVRGVYLYGSTARNEAGPASGESDFYGGIEVNQSDRHAV